MRRTAELLAVRFHHRRQYLLASFEAEPEERGARIGEHVEQRQRQLHRGDGGDASASPVTALVRLFFIGGSLLVVVTPVLPWTGEGAAALLFRRQFNSGWDIPRRDLHSITRYVSR